MRDVSSCSISTSSTLIHHTTLNLKGHQLIDLDGPVKLQNFRCGGSICSPAMPFPFRHTDASDDGSCIGQMELPDDKRRSRLHVRGHPALLNTSHRFTASWRLAPSSQWSTGSPNSEPGDFSNREFSSMRLQGATIVQRRLI